MSQIQVNTLRCPYCHDSLAGAAPKAGCGSCLAWHHSACLLELGQCANCGVESSLKATLDAHFKESLAAHHRAEEARKATLCGKGLGCPAKAELKVFGEELCATHAKSKIWLTSYWRWAGLVMTIVPLVLCGIAATAEPDLLPMGVVMGAIFFGGSEYFRRKAKAMKAELQEAVAARDARRAEPVIAEPERRLEERIKA
jgi:hypothetical protein